ncbi:MAG: hypothetical protein L0H94_10525 [Nitrospira sp.]|nr:hypothetical protein [Nitrospira sp.]
MIPHTQSSTVEARHGWRHVFFSDSVRFVIAPLILLFSGFFTTKFILSGAYTWPRTSQTLALMLIVFILSREFVYKEHLSRYATPTRAWAALAFSCVLPYMIGVVVVLTLWAK